MKKSRFFQKVMYLFLCFLTIFNTFIPVHAEINYDGYGDIIVGDLTEEDFDNFTPEDWENFFNYPGWEEYIPGGTVSAVVDGGGLSDFVNLKNDEVENYGYSWYIYDPSVTDNEYHLREITDEELLLVSQYLDSRNKNELTSIVTDFTLPANIEYIRSYLQIKQQVDETIEELVNPDPLPQRDYSAEGFYVNDTNELDKLFSLKLSDVAGVNAVMIGEKVLDWLMDSGTFVVVRKYIEADTGKEKIKVYVNTPNVQQYLKNQVVSLFPGGWDGAMFTPKSNLIESVGKDTGNVVNTFGFNLPTNKYKGEYSTAHMSLSGVLPIDPNASFLSNIWTSMKRFVGSIFGFSILVAPDAENFRSLYYKGNTYKNAEAESLIKWVQDNWIPFENQILYTGFVSKNKNDVFSEAYFSNPGQVLDEMVLKRDYEAARDWNAAHQEEYDECLELLEKKAFFDSHWANRTVFVSEESEGVMTDSEYYALWKEKHDAFLQDYRDWLKVKEQPKENPGEGNPGEDTPKPTPPKPKIPLPGQPIYINGLDENETTTNTVTVKAVDDSSGPSLEYPEPNWFDYVPEEWSYGGDFELSEQQLAIIQKYQANLALMDKYYSFNAKMDAGTSYIAEDDIESVGKVLSLFNPYTLAARGVAYLFNEGESFTAHPDAIGYSQCLFTDGGEECKKNINGSDYTMTLIDFYCKSGVYEVSKGKTELSRQDAIKIINKLQSYCGAAFPEVFANFTNVVTLALAYREQSVDELHKAIVDSRNMPYDTSTLVIEQDKADINVVDPRVELYKQNNTIGTLLVSGRFNLFKGAEDTGENIFNILLSISGSLAKLSIFFNDLCSLDWMENNGLDPREMWISFSVTLIASLLMAIMLFNIVRLCWQYLKGKAGVLQIFGRVAVFMLILFLIIALTDASTKDRTWNTLKKTFSIASNLGENGLLEQIGGEWYQQLNGDGQKATAYYIPYFNMWTTYMTGYTLADSQQQIKFNDPAQPETDGLYVEEEGYKVPYINEKPTTLWSVVLADSFNTLGKDPWSLKENATNEHAVNRNAYRVVDHFMAPRLTVDESKFSAGNINESITNTVNENYNGMFQKINLITASGQFLTVFNVFLLSLIKFLTFLWFWFMLYTLIFNVLLGALENRGNIKEVMIKTFSPLLALIIVGLYTGILVQLSTMFRGVINLLVSLFMFVLTALVMQAFSSSKYFPATLKPVLIITTPITSLMGYRQRRQSREMDFEAQQNNIQKDENGRYKSEDFLNQDGTFKFEDNVESKERLNRTYELQMIQDLRNGNHTSWDDATKLHYEQDKEFFDTARYINQRKTNAQFLRDLRERLEAQKLDE